MIKNLILCSRYRGENLGNKSSYDYDYDDWHIHSIITQSSLYIVYIRRFIVVTKKTTTTITNSLLRYLTHWRSMYKKKWSERKNGSSSSSRKWENCNLDY